jgi:hypothetical protein
MELNKIKFKDLHNQLILQICIKIKILVKIVLVRLNNLLQIRYKINLKQIKI